MLLLLLFCIVILIVLAVSTYYKIKAYNGKDRSIWQDGDSVVIRKKDAESAGRGFATRLDNKVQ